ncbi:response regulator [Rhodanobacter sp. L36]|uniref:response regulator n=1 Tax=Rhodanobacter sp. L36 TaxID=1747221 RepID=UPI00131E21A9|nr:response regulator [Rhodanobacter sp. L36]
MISVILVDDHELVRTGFRMILQQQPDIEVVGEADSAEEGLRLIRSLAPDIALVDVHMPGMSGIELTERIGRSKMSTRIIIVTVVDDARFPKRLLDAGALGYLTKGCSANELVLAVKQVATGRRYLAPAVAQQLALATLDGHSSPFDVLSSRELEVAMMLVRGKPLTAIGEQLSLSPKTVSTYKQRLMEKLHVDHVLSLAHLMTVHGLLDSPNHHVGTPSL